MKNFESTKRIQSKVTEGVSFVIRVITAGIRDRLNLQLAEVTDKARDLQARLRMLNLPLKEDGTFDAEAEVDLETVIQMEKLVEDSERIKRTEVDPVFMDACFVAVEGLTIDGEPVKSAVQLRDFGPEELYREVVAAVRAEAELTAKERENLESPITSAAEADGRMRSSTAAPASSNDSTSTGTA